MVVGVHSGVVGRLADSASAPAVAWRTHAPPPPPTPYPSTCLRFSAQLHAALFPTLSDYYPSVFPASVFTLERLRWARALLDSRELVVRRRGALTTCLVPLVDMLNHAPAAHCWHRRYDDERELLCVELNAPASAGQQLFLSYGPLRSWQLLQYYGFVPDTNPYDAVDVRLGELAALSADQRRAFEGLAVTADHAVRAGPPAPACLAYVRIAHATAAELRACAAGAGGEAILAGPISERNERAARAALRSAVASLRERWRPDTPDNMLVRGAAAGPDLASCMLAVRFRRSQLKLLDAALAAL